MQITVAHIDEIDKVAETVINTIKQAGVVCFYGDLGTGKTTLIKAICKRLGVREEMSSPTFSIINIYEGNTGEIYHMDLYRLKNTDEAINIGIEDYLYNGHHCFIEWPQVIEKILPEKYCKVEITLTHDNKRIINLTLEHT